MYISSKSIDCDVEHRTKKKNCNKYNESDYTASGKGTEYVACPTTTSS